MNLKWLLIYIYTCFFKIAFMPPMEQKNKNKTTKIMFISYGWNMIKTPGRTSLFQAQAPRALKNMKTFDTPTMHYKLPDQTTCAPILSSEHVLLHFHGNDALYLRNRVQNYRYLSRLLQMKTP